MTCFRIANAWMQQRNWEQRNGEHGQRFDLLFHLEVVSEAACSCSALLHVSMAPTHQELKIQDLAHQELKIQDLAHQELKIQDLAHQELKLQSPKHRGDQLKNNSLAKM